MEARDTQPPHPGKNQGRQDVSAHRTGWHFTGEGNEGPQVQGLQRVLSRRHLSKCMMSNVLRVCSSFSVLHGMVISPVNK
jgi:hypothetical protein